MFSIPSQGRNCIQYFFINLGGGKAFIVLHLLRSLTHQVLVVQRDQGRQADLVRLVQDAGGVGQTVVAGHKDVAGLGYCKEI